MLSITAVSAGAVDYLLRGSGCAGHGVDAEAPEQALAPEAPGVDYLVGSPGTGEELADGVWFGRGLPMVGIAAGSRAQETDVRAVLGSFVTRTPRRRSRCFWVGRRDCFVGWRSGSRRRAPRNLMLGRSGGKINLFSLDSLVNMVAAAGLHVEMSVGDAA
jgi:hypothetical protein